jgi:F420-dependent oxidoreductase-like protein
MQVGISLPIGHVAPRDWNDLVTLATEAERLGASHVWSPEAWNYDAVTPLGYMAAKTSRIKLGTGIMQAGTRTPALVAMTALTLAWMSNDRFVLGLASSGPQVIEGWHGVPFQPPLARIREIVDIVRMVSRGERLAYKGKVYELPRPGGEGRALRSGAQPRPIPIYIGALTPKSLEMTGEIADGWLGVHFAPEYADMFLAPIARGAAKAGRKLSDLDIRASSYVEFTDDVERAVAKRRPEYAFHLGGMGTRKANFYNDTYTRAGYGEESRRIQELWLEGRRDEAAALVPEHMVTRIDMIGTDGMIRERIRRFRAAGVTNLRIDPAGQTLDQKLETLARTVNLISEVSRESAPSSGVAP